MDKGIRPYCINKFNELNVQRKAGTITNTVFRKTVMADCMEAFGISLASAATHYNHAFKEAKRLTPADLEGLGRAEDKKGGRKPKAKAELVGPVQPPTDLTAAEVTAPAVTEVPEQTEFTVKKKSDGSIVAEKLSYEDAIALVEKAKLAKKAALYWV